jgi:hypothetical protein
MLSNAAVVILLLFPVLTTYLLYKNYQLEKRWRCLRYCWHIMSDFAGESARGEDGSWDLGWKEVVNEHKAFLRNFSVDLLSNQQIELYEAALLEHDLPILVEHKMW